MILRAFRVGRPAVKQFAGRLLSFPPGGIACSRLRAPCSTVLTGLGLFGVACVRGRLRASVGRDGVSRGEAIAFEFRTLATSRGQETARLTRRELWGSSALVV
jgi:hypothetical protein